MEPDDDTDNQDPSPAEVDEAERREQAMREMEAGW